MPLQPPPNVRAMTSALALEHPSLHQPLTRLQRRERTARALAESGTTSSASRRQELLDYVVRINMGVAHSVARRYVHRGIEEDDLVQVAYTALIRAARGFDPSRDQDFLSYAVPTIRGELKKHFRDRGWVVRPPRRIQEIQGKLTRAEEDLTHELGHRPRPEELADHLQVEVAEVREAQAADGCFSPSSLDRPVAGLDGGGFATVGDLVGEDDRSQAAAEARVTLAPVLRRLKERDRRILYMRFFEERTQQEIAEDIGVTQMQVSRLLTRIMRDLRDDLADLADPVSPRRVA
jgi:RNA polymerase sigma-B factor